MDQLTVVPEQDLDASLPETPPRLEVKNAFGSEIEVEVVIVNYRRPGNIPQIIEGFRAQTVPCRITICDVGRGKDRVPCEVRSTVDATIDFSDNAGGFNRYVAVNAFRLPFTWFHDDDMVPGPRMVEGFLRFNWISYAVLGHIGRLVGKSRFSEVKAEHSPIPVDFLVRGYWVRTQDLPMIQRFLWKAWEIGYEPGVREDDILLLKGIEAYTGRRAIVVPPLPDGRMNARDLPEPHAQCIERNHIPRRIQFVHLANSIIQAMHHEPRRVVFVGSPAPARLNLADHLRSAGLESWLRKCFADAEVLLVEEGDEFCLRALSLTDRDLVVGFSRQAGFLADLGDHVPRIAIPPVTLSDAHPAMPDMALFLDREFNPPVYDRDGMIVVVDEPDGPWRSQLIDSVSDLGMPFDTITTIESPLPVKTGLRSWLFRRKVAGFSSVRAVLTDNPDYLAFAIIARTPCVVIAGSSAEAALRAPSWLSSVSAVRMISDPGLASVALEAAMKGSYRELPDFEKLITCTLESLCEEVGGGTAPFASPTANGFV